LEDQAAAFDRAVSAAEERQALSGILLTLAVMDPRPAPQALPGSVRDLIAEDLLLDRVVRRQTEPSVEAAWKVGTLWVIKGLRVAGDELVVPRGSAPDALPQVQAFEVVADYVVRMDPDGSRPLVRGWGVEGSGPAQAIVVP
jgi:hypothetical protein